MTSEVRPFSDKVIRRIATTDRLQFYEGPVRSGKTIASILSLIYYIGKYPVRQGIMSGATVGSVVRNVIKGDFGFTSLCPQSKLTTPQTGTQIEVQTSHGPVTIYVFGGGKSDSADSLRGLSADFWYADEITKHHESFVSEGMARVSASRHPFMLWTSNPDNPHHFLYTKYTDVYKQYTDEQKQDFGGYHEYHFTLSDNPAMTPAMIRKMELTYTGVEYRRKVLGERCIAEGLVYPGATEELICDGIPASDVRIRYCAIDFGVNHATVMYLGGPRRSDPKRWHVVAEYFSKQEDKTTADFFEDFVTLCERHGVSWRDVEVAIDPAAGALKVEFMRRGARAFDAKNSVLDGIEYTRKALYNRWLTVSPTCRHLLRQLSTYVWDEKAALTGVDRPMKVEDDCPDTLRYLAYTFMRMWVQL